MPVYDKLGRHRTHWTNQSFDAHYASTHSSELQMHKFPHSLNELKFYSNYFSGHKIGCSRQEIKSIHTFHGCTVFPCHGIHLEWRYRNGKVPSFHLKMPGGSLGHAVCNSEPISGKKSPQRNACFASVHCLDIRFLYPYNASASTQCIAVQLYYSGLIAAADCRHCFTGAAKQPR